MISIIIPDYNEPNIKLMKAETRRYFPSAEIIIVHDLNGKGKGRAVREGLAQATGDLIAFLDADLDIHPKMINRLLPFLEDYDIVVGMKGIEKGLLKRRFITYLSRAYIRVMFGLKCDTQTGIKLFKREAIQNWKTNGFAYDIELLMKAKKKGYTMVEVPIDAKITVGVSLKAILRTFKESLKIWYAYFISSK